METLELKHIAPYLPYELEYQRQIDEAGTLINQKVEMVSLDIHVKRIIGGIKMKYGLAKPILYPLDWLTKEIEHNGEKFVPEYWIDDKLGRSIDDVITDNRFVLELPYFVMQKLIEWHFNVFNLPEHLYIDKSTIK